MKYNSLGETNISISQIGFGCMSLDGTQSDNAKILHYALDHGINYFDTADVYNKGENEISIGKAFKTLRSKVIIATKVGNQWKQDGTGFNWNPSKTHILQSVEGSLNRLQTDYIDLYQLHGGTIDDPIDETLEAFETLKQQGKIRHYGISSIRPNVIREYVKRSNMVSVMMQYSLLDRRPEESCLNLLENSKISVLARGTLAKGLLVDKPAIPFLNHNESAVDRAKKAIENLCSANRSATEVAIQYVLHSSAVSSVVIGVRTMEQLKNILAIHDAKLTDAEIKMLRDSVKMNYYDQHR